MSASATPFHPLASVLKHGKDLTTRLRRAKARARSNRGTINIYEKVEQIITNLAADFNREQGVASFPEESLTRTLKKIVDILQEFITIDNGRKSEYESLVKKVNELKPRRDQSSAATGASSSSPAGCDPYGQSSSFYDPIADFNAAYAGLNVKEKQCLSCVTLFPAGEVIKKRELIHIWVGMDLIDSPLAGDDMLAKLVLEGFIERVIGNKRLTSRYKMHEGVRSLVSNQSTDGVGQFTQTGSWSVMHKTELTEKRVIGDRALYVRTQTLYTRGPRSGVNTVSEMGEVEVLLNINQNALNAHRIESVSKMRSLKVLHLGSWRSDPENYIVAEGIDDLKELRHVMSLSLQGVSGIKKLPESVYKHPDLKVLDLRACHNLELINAEGIALLKNLTHLDLTECCLLDHVPKAITQLTNLQVLKGFVINALQPPKKTAANQDNSMAPCELRDLSELKKIIKLTVRSRRLSFPTAEDLGVLSNFEELISLRIAWVASSNDCQPYGGIGGLFPKKLKKLELQAAPDGTASRLLDLISSTTEDNSLEKLYIRGGGLSDLSPKHHHLPNVKVLRLKYLYDLYIDWVKFRKLVHSASIILRSFHSREIITFLLFPHTCTHFKSLITLIVLK